MATETKIVLFSNQLEQAEPGSGKQRFNISHAEKIIANTRSGLGDWELADDKYTVENGFIKLADTGKNQKPGREKSTPQSS